MIDDFGEHSAVEKGYGHSAASKHRLSNKFLESPSTATFGAVNMKTNTATIFPQLTFPEYNDLCSEIQDSTNMLGQHLAAR